MKSVMGWVALLALGLMLIAVGFRGRLGSLAAAIISPSQLVDVTDTSTPAATPIPGGGVAKAGGPLYPTPGEQA